MEPSGLGRALAAVYLLCGLLGVAVVSVVTPPLQVADEDAHFERADQIAGGGLIGRRYAALSTSGGEIDRALYALIQAMKPLSARPTVRLGALPIAAIRSLRWAGRADGSFPNTAIYPPVLYLPAVIGILAGRRCGLSVVHSLVLSRLLMGGADVALGTAAIALAAGAAPLLFGLLSMPMSLTLFASASQDGPIIALAALASALLRRASDPARARRRPAFGVACLCIALISSAKPAYLPLAGMLCLPLMPARLPVRVAAIALVASATLGWIAVVDRAVQPAATAARVSAQARFLLAHPSLLPAIAGRAAAILVGAEQGREFVGVLGWLDAPLPAAGYAVLGAMLAGLAAATMCSREAPVAAGARIAALLAIAACVVAICASQYLYWTGVGARTIAGIEGRYMIPVALFLPLALPTLGRRPVAGVLALAAAPVFAAVSLTLTVAVLLHRYYA